MKIPLLEQTGGDRVDDVSYQLTQNWYPHVTPESKSNLILYPTPGLTLFANLGSLGNIRGSIVYGDEYYCVYHNGLYKVDSVGSEVLLGTISTSTGRVSMAHNGANNGKQIMIADGSDLWCYDVSADTLTEVTLFDDNSTTFSISPTHVVFIDSYFVINDPANSGRFYISAGYDGEHNSGWDTLDFATAERSPDELQSIVVSDRILWLIGTHTSEAWYNAGATDFPFLPMQGGFSQWGTIAPYSPTEISGTVLWLTQNEEGDGLVAMSVTGGYPKIVSTPGIAAEIGKLSTKDDAYGWTYQKDQHTFYVLTFPTEQRTFVYDLSINKWHEMSTTSTGYHRSNNHAYVYGKHLIGDPLNGKIYYLDWSKYTDNGEQITRLRRSPNIQAEDVQLRHFAVHLDIKEGVGNSDVTEPSIHLRWRDDMGTWSNYYTRSMGVVGDHKKKVVFRRLGRTSERMYEIRVTDPCNAVLIDAYAILRPDEREIA